MYPNPQAALPLPPRPNLEQYRKLAKDLVKACKSAEAATSAGVAAPFDAAKADAAHGDAIADWVRRWLDALAARQLDAPRSRRNLSRDIAAQQGEIATFARERLTRDARGRDNARDADNARGASAAASRCQLSEAQFVIARAHGFMSWPKFVTHLESLGEESSEEAAFESAVRAVVTGDEATLSRLLRAYPGLARRRSTREHQATLLHYVSANGVEGYRQVSPPNAAAITTMLLDAGSDVDAGADVYHGSCTALGLVATSGPPAHAGVQIPVIDVLLARGARMDLPGSAGNNHSLLLACLGNGQGDAARYLFERGAPVVDLLSAAGLGELELVQRFLASQGRRLSPDDRPSREAFGAACSYGRVPVVEYFLDHGMPVDVEMAGHGAGHTGLHGASFFAHVPVVQLLLRRGASVHTIDKTWHSSPLGWALAGWERKEPPHPRLDNYYAVVALLVAAGATVTKEMREWDRVRADPRMMAALSATAATPPPS